MKTALSSIIVAESEPCNSLDNISVLTIMVTSKSATPSHIAVSSTPQRVITSLPNSDVSSVSTVAFPSVSSSTICTDHRNEYDLAFYRDKVKGMKNSEILSLIKSVFVSDELYTLKEVFVLTGLKAILGFVILPVWLVGFVFLVLYLEVCFQQN